MVFYGCKSWRFTGTPDSKKTDARQSRHNFRNPLQSNILLSHNIREISRMIMNVLQNAQKICQNACAIVRFGKGYYIPRKYSWKTGSPVSSG